MYMAVGPCPFVTLLISWVFSEGGSSVLFFSISFLDHLLVTVVYILYPLVYFCFFFFFFLGGGGGGGVFKPLKKEMCTIVDDRCSKNTCRRRKPTSRNVKALFCLFTVYCLISSEITLLFYRGEHLNK